MQSRAGHQSEGVRGVLCGIPFPAFLFPIVLLAALLARPARLHASAPVPTHPRVHRTAQTVQPQTPPATGKAAPKGKSGAKAGSKAKENDSAEHATPSTPPHARSRRRHKPAEPPADTPTLYRAGYRAGTPQPAGRHRRLIVPAPLRGSHEVLVHQNAMADSEGLERIEDESELERLRAARLLVPVTESSALHIDPELPAVRRTARPWTARFAGDIARAYHARFGRPLQLNSAVRTVDYQLRLQQVNGNAAAVEGDTASPHLTGQAIDLGKRGMGVAQIAWMRAYLKPLMEAGKIDVEEEFQQACFHISVYRSYLPSPPAPRRRAHGSQAPGSQLAQLHGVAPHPSRP